MSTSLRLRYAAQDAILEATVARAKHAHEAGDPALAEAITAEGQRLAEKWNARDWLTKAAS